MIQFQSAQAPALPQPTYCPNPLCNYLEATTICKWCQTDKTATKAAPARVHHFAASPVNPEHPDDGIVKVKFATPFRGRKCDVMLVVAPAEPDVGLLQPWVMAASIFDLGGQPMRDVTMQESRELLSLVSWAL